MIETVARYDNDPLEPLYIGELTPKVNIWDAEIGKLLPTAPSNPHIYWFSKGQHLDYRTGVGGFAYADDALSLWFDPKFVNRDQQIEDLRGIYFHEKYHLAQGWVELTDMWEGIPAIGHAIFEGSAIVFARESAGYNAANGLYPESKIKGWLDEVKQMGSDYKKHIWKDDYDDSNILYPVGTFVVENVLKNNPDLAVVDLATVHWQKILELSKL